MGVEIPINPKLITWARETAGYTLEELASASGFSRLPEWEAGERFPTYAQLEKIADKLHRPIAVFFFPEPPDETGIEKSLRAMTEEDVQKLSPLIRQLFRKAKAFQLSLRELWEENPEHRNTVQWMKSVNTQNVKALAKEVREILGVSLEQQKKWKNSDEALKNWRNVLAIKGVYVFKEAFKAERIAGFCIYDDFYPIIFLNNSLSKNRQIFTMFHELGHILFKDSYLDVFDARFWELEHLQPAHIEVKCNAFAGEFLVPEADIISHLPTNPLDRESLMRLADAYHVSRDVMLRKFLNLKVINQQTYEHQIREWSQSFQEKQEAADSTNKKSEGNYYNSKIAYLGDAYLSLVLRSYSRGQISMEEAASHLDVKMKAFPVIEEKFLSRGGSVVRL